MKTTALAPEQLDLQTRQQALDPAQSFIIQAPAGSGKTELLTQRYLSLLSQACAAPEEIIAITFTRKAALQMRERILTALQLAENPQPPETAHRFTTWRLAREALKQDQRHQWRLLDNPQRLRILTIDALCGQLSNRLPLLSGYGAPARIVEDATPYYQQAVQELILHSTPVALLTHLDNNAAQLSQLCIELLARREQWLPYLVYHAQAPQLRQKIEQGLGQLAQEILAAAHRQFSPGLQQQLIGLLSFAAAHLSLKQPTHTWLNRDRFPSTQAEELPAWQSLAQALLTEAGEWRKKVDIRNGFPPKTAEKTAFEALLNGLAGNTTLKAHLQQIRMCPPIHYNDQQWLIITTLIETLPSLVAQLQLIFQQQGVMDFIEMGLCASRALGQEEQPTDLALALDYRIRHFLIDEFQDTSVAHFTLFEKLLLGWEPGDGRSIFLVGDPMQSIYRFRNAEVGLFLRTSQQGIQNIRLKPLYLTFNFRSGRQLIDWFNQVFPQVLAPEDNLTTGAIAYKSSAAMQPQLAQPAVRCYACTSPADEANQVIALIQQCRNQYPGEKIAVLVRSRSHLLTLLPALHAAKIQFQAVELEPLAQRSEIRDLVALTQALHHRADRIAWLSVLRAPYCGLSLVDIHAITQASEHQTLYETLTEFSTLADLSSDARQRLQRIVPVLSEALSNRGRLAIAEWIESTWQRLGGPAGLDSADELINAHTYFALLTKLTQTCPGLDLAALPDQLKKLYAAPDALADASLQIMTIHKAKGLEFEHVILPGLQHKPTADSNKLFLWMERANARAGSDLILAPIKAAGAASDPVYTYLKQIEQQKLLHEAGRLLYVATTRAQQSLHLLAVLPAVPDIQAWNPITGSFLQMLWPYFREQLAQHSAHPGFSAELTNPPTVNLLQRLTADWQLPPPPAGHAWVFKPAVWIPSQLTTMSIPDRRAAWIGTVIHEALADLAMQAPDFAHIADPRWKRRLRQAGLVGVELAEGVHTVQTALEKTLQDPRGLWILSVTHQDRRNEYALSAALDGQSVQIIIDRTFVDAGGVRWIIDYKTSDVMDADLSSYYQQLTRYAQVMALQDPETPIRLGLYFPLCGGWREWGYKYSI